MHTDSGCIITLYVCKLFKVCKFIIANRKKNKIRCYDYSIYHEIQLLLH